MAVLAAEMGGKLDSGIRSLRVPCRCFADVGVADVGGYLNSGCNVACLAFVVVIIICV